MINNKELIPLLYVGLKGKDLNKEIFDDGGSFLYVSSRFRVLEIKEYDEDFFDDFVITEELITKSDGSIDPGFSCIVKFKENIYIYEVNYDYMITIYRMVNNPVPKGEIYKEVEEDDENYDFLSEKIEILNKLIFEKSKYRLAELLRKNNDEIDYINF